MMLAFNRMFLFENEPALTDIVYASHQTIKVKECHQSLHEIFTLKSDWVTMSGRNLRYFTQKPFEEQDKITHWALEIKDVLILIWNSEAETIYYIKHEKYRPKLLQFWILHTFFPLVLELEKMAHILHVSAVEINQKVILFSAFSGGGKSTLTNYFINQGHTIYGDDTIALTKHDNTYHVIPSYPFHRPYRRVEDLGYNIEHFGTNIKELSRIYSLYKVAKDEEVSIRTLYGIEKFKALYQSDFVMFEAMQTSRYFFTTEMAKYVEVYQISVPWNLTRLDEVYQAIVTHNHV